MIKKIFLIFILIIAVFLTYVAFQPSHYTITREIALNVKPDSIFPWINDPQKIHQWSPWVEMDPQLKMNYSGPTSGVGSQANWDSTGQMGTGSATIVESTPNQSVKTKLEYTKPFQMTQEAELSIKSDGSHSVVRWSVSGQRGFIGRVMCVFINIDKMVGESFEKGLAKLKSIIENSK